MKLARGWLDRDGRLTRGTAAKDLRTTAIHEAAHAVVAHAVGGRVVSLKIKRPGVGQTHWQVERRGRHPDVVLIALVALAGHEAEHRAYGRPIDLLPEGDWNMVVRLGTSPKARQIMGWLARQSVRKNMPAIRAVQRALLRRGSLTRRQFLAALREAA